MKKIIVILCTVAGLIAVWVLFFKPAGQKPLVDSTITQQILPQKAEPSKTFLEYIDPSGFTFNYPDNLSITKKEIEDDNVYADLQLSSNETNGSLSLKVSDSKFKSLDEWLKSNKIESNKNTKEVKLGNLNALEVYLNDRLILASLDQGILFNIEMPLIEKDFWISVYNKILTDFSFASPDSTSSEEISASTDISFEGEDVVVE